MAALRAAIGRAARRLFSEEVLVFLRGPCPKVAAAQPAEGVTKSKLTPERRLFSEKVLVFFRGPRPNPAAAAASAAQPAEKDASLLLKKPRAIGRRGGSASRYSQRPTRLRKTNKAIPWLVGTFVILSFLEGLDEVGKDDEEKPREG